MLKIGVNQAALYWFALLSALMLSVLFTGSGTASFFQTAAGNETSFNGTLFNGLTSVRFLATLGYLGLCVAYVIWLTNWQYRALQLKFTQMLRLGSPFLLLSWLAYPLSSDVYLYLQYGLMGLRGANPYVISASKVSTMLDPFLYWLQTSTYGPISEVTFVISALFIKFSPILAIYVFKAFCLLAHILNAYLIWRILLFSPHRHILTAAYLFSPFLLIAHIADAHVDVFLCTSIIVLLGCLHRQFYLGAVLALIAGFLTKTLPVIWFPLVFLFLIRQRRWKTVAVAVVMSGAIFLLLSQTLFPNLAAWKSLLNPGVSGMTARSLHHLVNLFWGLVTHSRLIQQVGLVQQLSRISLAIFALFYAWKLARLYFKRNYSEVDLVPDLGWVTLFLLLGATPWLMSWYPSILLPIGILSINAPIFTLVSFVFPLTAGAVIGAGSGDTLLSLVGCFVTLVPTFAILLFRRQLLPICQAFTNTESVPSDQVVAQTRQLLRR